MPSGVRERRRPQRLRASSSDRGPRPVRRRLVSIDQSRRAACRAGLKSIRIRFGGGLRQRLFLVFDWSDWAWSVRASGRRCAVGTFNCPACFTVWEGSTSAVFAPFCSSCIGWDEGAVPAPAAPAPAVPVSAAPAACGSPSSGEVSSPSCGPRPLPVDTGLPWVFG